MQARNAKIIMKNLRRLSVALLAALLLCTGPAAGIVMAASDSEIQEATGKASVSSHSAESKLQFGTIVQLIDQEAKKVAPASGKDPSKMYGVTVDPNHLSVTLSNSSLENETYVATSGTFNVLVSTEEGAIRSGDYLTISAIDGVAMKAGDYQKHNMVFGRAAADFDGKSTNIGQMTLAYEGGEDKEVVQLGLIQAAINIQRNPNDRSTKANLPPMLERIGQAIAERQVSPFRIYLAIGVAGLTVMVALVTLRPSLEPTHGDGGSEQHPLRLDAAAVRLRPPLHRPEEPEACLRLEPASLRGCRPRWAVLGP